MILEATLEKPEYGLFCGPTGGGWGKGAETQKQEKEARVHVRCSRLHSNEGCYIALFDNMLEMDQV